ncbi:hypothetical protein HDU91_002498 [Kappamyces sp. JEL0680]|nr:hypothetical protein HDU91_002498 [Kappamyces sp. JEL0680]
MGIEVPCEIDEEFEGFTPTGEMSGQKLATVSALLRQTRQLKADDLKLYFETLFSRMTTSSKEAVTEIMWTNYTVSHTFSGGVSESRGTNTGDRGAGQIRTSSNRSDRVGHNNHSALEDEFFTMLREAIVRSDRNVAPRPQSARQVPATRTAVMDITMDSENEDELRF